MTSLLSWHWPRLPTPTSAPPSSVVCRAASASGALCSPWAACVLHCMGVRQQWRWAMCVDLVAPCYCLPCRCNIGVELLSNPSLVFADEPTSGGWRVSESGWVQRGLAMGGGPSATAAWFLCNGASNHFSVLHCRPGRLSSAERDGGAVDAGGQWPHVRAAETLLCCAVRASLQHGWWLAGFCRRAV